MLISAITLALDNRHSLPDGLASEWWEGERGLRPTYKYTHTTNGFHSSTCKYGNVGISLFLPPHASPYSLTHTHTHTNMQQAVWLELLKYGNSGNSYWHFWLTDHTSSALQYISKYSFKTSGFVFVRRCGRGHLLQVLHKVTHLAWIVAPFWL